MKKYITVIILVSVMLGIIISYNIYFTYKTCPINNDMQIEIDKILVSDLSDDDLESFSIGKGFYNCRLDEREIQALYNHQEEYKKITIDYYANNHSETIDIFDIRFQPIFDTSLDRYVDKYNTGNGTYFVHVKKGAKGHIRQYILLKNINLSDEEIYEALFSCKVEMTYFTGELWSSNGQELIGRGKHKIVFNMSDGRIISNK